MYCILYYTTVICLPLPSPTGPSQNRTRFSAQDAYMSWKIAMTLLQTECKAGNEEAKIRGGLLRVSDSRRPHWVSIHPDPRLRVCKYPRFPGRSGGAMVGQPLLECLALLLRRVHHRFREIFRFGDEERRRDEGRSSRRRFGRVRPTVGRSGRRRNVAHLHL